MTLSRTSLVVTAGGTMIVAILAAWSVAPAVSDTPIGATAWRQMAQRLREKDPRRPAPRGIASTAGRRPAAAAPTLWASLTRLAPFEATLAAAGPIGTLATEGDVTHAAYQARATYGVTGTGVPVGVL